MKSRLITLAVLVALLAVPAAWAQPEPAFSSEAGATGDANFAPPRAPSIVLYDQTDNASGNGAPDQNFEAAFDAYDSEGADDFVVDAADGWTIDELSIVGTQSTGGAPTGVNVFFYEDDATFPAAAPICSNPGAAFVGSDSITSTIDPPCILPPGTYWVAHQVDQSFGAAGQHFWSNRTVASNSDSVWRNPGGGFGTPCTDWDRQASVCGVGGGASPDFLFALNGEIGGAVPTVPFAGLMILMAVLLGVGLVVLIRR